MITAIERFAVLILTSAFSVVGLKLEDNLDLIKDFTLVLLHMHLIVVLLALPLRQMMCLQEALVCWQV